MQRQIADLVQQQRPSVGFLEQAALGGGSAGEGALGVAEQLALDQLLRDRAAVDRHERPFGARRHLVESARDQLLPRPALAHDEDRGLRRRDFVHEPENVLHRGRLGDDGVGAAGGLDLPAQAPVLRAQPLPLLRLAQDEQHLVWPERLAQVVVGARLHRLERKIVRSVRAHDDDGGFRGLLLHRAHQREPIHARHAHVGDQCVVVAGGELAQRLVAVLHRAHEVSLLRQEHGEHVPDRLLVVGDEDRAQRHGQAG